MLVTALKDGIYDGWAVLKCWIAIEILFMCYAAWRHFMLSSKLTRPQQYPTSRKRLFSRIVSYLLLHNVDFKEFISGWFMGAQFEDIKFGNVEEFLAWAFFATSPDKINAQEELEVHEMINDMCSSFDVNIASGFTPGTRHNYPHV